MRSLFRYQPPNPQQKCHPDRSAAQWRDLLFIIRGNESEWKRRRPLCHPDRSVAQWRDLQLSGFILEMFSDRIAANRGRYLLLPLQTKKTRAAQRTSCATRARLPQQLQCKLQIPIIKRRSSNRSHIPIRNIRVRITKIRVIDDVKRLSTELSRQLFRDTKVLQRREIKLSRCRAAERIPRHSPLNPGRRHHIGSRIKPMRGAALSDLPARPARSDVHPLWNIRAASARPGAAGERGGKTGTQLDDELYLPSTRNPIADAAAAQEALACAERKFVTRTAHRTAARVVV